MVLWEGFTGLRTGWCGFEVSLLVVAYPFGGTRDVRAGSWLAVAGLDPIRWFALRVAAGSGRTYIGREGTQGDGRSLRGSRVRDRCHGGAHGGAAGGH